MWSNLTARLTKKASHSSKAPTSKRTTGDVAERIAKSYVRQHGLNVIDQNVLYRQGEIDLIAMDNEQLVFIEVRFRKNASHGGALASVTPSKQQKIVKAAQLYLQQTFQHRPPSCRFDVIGISGSETQPDITWIKNAFC